MTQTRRQFLRRAIGTATVALAPTLETLAQTSQPTSNPSTQTALSSQPSKPIYSFNDYIDAIIQIESGGNPRAKRPEPEKNDASYGLGQILTKTAKDIEKRHSELPQLGNTHEQIRDSLYNPEINRAYTTVLYREELDFYQDPFLAVAAYNSGHLTPRNAHCQEQLNDLYKASLITDGHVFGEAPESRAVIKRFQEQHNLEADGILGPKTYAKLQDVWKSKFPNKPNPKGKIPINKYTPNHVRKFRKALESK